MNNLKTFLSDISLIWWIISTFIIGSGILIYFCKYIKVQWRFAKNLKKKIYFLKTSNDKNLQTQRDKIKNLHLFNIEEDIKDISSNLTVLQNLKNNAVYVVGYNKDYDYNNLFTEVKNNEIPIIIFANQGEIKKDWNLFNNYIYCDISNTTNRLAVILLNILKIV
jgi:hypothetical protein